MSIPQNNVSLVTDDSTSQNKRWQVIQTGDGSNVRNHVWTAAEDVNPLPAIVLKHKRTRSTWALLHQVTGTKGLQDFYFLQCRILRKAFTRLFLAENNFRDCGEGITLWVFNRLWSSVQLCGKDEKDQPGSGFTDKTKTEQCLWCCLLGWCSCFIDHFVLMAKELLCQRTCNI